MSPDAQKRLANYIDWYLTQLNHAHLIPANVATFARSISAKQLGGLDFTPRPLTVNSFTDPELDAIYRLSHKKPGVPGGITADSYSRIVPPEDREAFIGYSPENSPVGTYLSPLGVIRTTIGQAGLANDKEGPKIVDEYDFNRPYIHAIPFKDEVLGDGYLINNRQFVSEKNFKEPINRLNTTYSRLRNRAVEYAHVASDPSSSKIQVTLPIRDIERRLGKNIGKYDITKPMSKKDMILRGMASGGITALPFGALLGLISGGIKLTSKNNRKKWLKTLLLHTAAGAGIAGLIGAAGGGSLASAIHSRFNKKAEDDLTRKRRKRGGIAVSDIAAYAIPLLMAAGIGYYGIRGMRELKEVIGRPVDPSKEYKLKMVDDITQLPDRLDAV